MSESTEIEYTLTLHADGAASELRKLEISMMRILSMLSRLTGDENIQKSIAKIERMIMTLRVLQATIRAVQMAEGPIGWLYAATTIVAAGISTSETIMDLGGT
jgi:hypothetical protein